MPLFLLHIAYFSMSIFSQKSSCSDTFQLIYLGITYTLFYPSLGLHRIVQHFNIQYNSAYILKLLEIKASPCKVQYAKKMFYKKIRFQNWWFLDLMAPQESSKSMTALNTSMFAQLFPGSLHQKRSL